jgi:hypothetical protein
MSVCVCVCLPALLNFYPVKPYFGFCLSGAFPFKVGQVSLLLTIALHI